MNVGFIFTHVIMTVKRTQQNYCNVSCLCRNCKRFLSFGDFWGSKTSFFFPNISAFSSNYNCTKHNTLYNFIDWTCFYDEMKGITWTAPSTGKYVCKIWERTILCYTLYVQIQRVLALTRKIQSGPRKSSPPSILHVSLLLY